MAKKILIIDDEQDMRVYLSTLFRKAGYETEDAENGLDGVAKAQSFAPDLITLDIMMPRRSGIKAYAELRTSPETRQTPVIVLTGISQPEAVFGEDLDLLPPPEAMVEKPIDREAFLRKVGEILGE